MLIAMLLKPSHMPISFYYCSDFISNDYFNIIYLFNMICINIFKLFFKFLIIKIQHSYAYCNVIKASKNA